MYVNSILIVSENSYLVIIPFKDSDCILLLLLSQVVSLFTELCNPHPVGVTQDVDVRLTMTGLMSCVTKIQNGSFSSLSTSADLVIVKAFELLKGY